MKKPIWLEQNDTRLINGFDFPKAVSRKPPPVNASVTSATKAARKTKETRNARHRLNGQGTLLVERGRTAVSGRAVRPLRKRLSSDMPGHSTNRPRSADFSDRLPPFFVIELPRKNGASKWRKRTLLETSTWKHDEKMVFLDGFLFLEKTVIFFVFKNPTCLGSRKILHASVHEKSYMPRFTKKPLLYWRRIDHHGALHEHVTTFASDSREHFTAGLSLYGSTCETRPGRVDFVPRKAAYFHTWMCVVTCTIILGIVCHIMKVKHMILCCALLSVFSMSSGTEKVLSA